MLNLKTSRCDEKNHCVSVHVTHLEAKLKLTPSQFEPLHCIVVKLKLTLCALKMKCERRVELIFLLIKNTVELCSLIDHECVKFPLSLKTMLTSQSRAMIEFPFYSCSNNIGRGKVFYGVFIALK